MRAYVGVTDDDWYRFLAEHPAINEVNFWRPSDLRTFSRIAAGEPFFFKTHYPHNRVVGGGFFSGFAVLRVSEAWDFFGAANGVANLDQMRSRIGHYRRRPIDADEDPEIGCIFVRDTRFFPADDDVAPPSGFPPSAVQGKGYDLADLAAAAYFGPLIDRVLGLHVEIDLAEPWHRSGPVYGDPRLAPQRLGQQAFQATILQTYHRRCAITGARIRPVLQAAHIRPLPFGGEHRTDNGILLRSDVHTMFDRGYLGIDPRHRLLVSPRLRDEFGNGESFYAKAGQIIELPERVVDRPHREFLEWHLDTVFKAA